MHLTNECARASLISDRCEGYRQSTIEQQTREESQKWHRGQKRKAERLAKELRGRPQSTVEKLKSFGEGTRLMIGCIQDLVHVGRTQGFLPADDLELALCMYGVTPTREWIRQDALAYLVNLYNLCCTPGVSSTVIEDWLKPANRPDVLQGLSDDQVIGLDADHNRELLVIELEGEVERLRVEADRLAREVDQPSLAAVLERALILSEEAARRVARSHGEARTTYHRASSALWPLLDREKKQGPPEPAGYDQDDEVEERAVPEPASAAEAGDREEAASSQPAPGRVPAVPGSARKEEAGVSENEPEDSSDISAQVVDDRAGSVVCRRSLSGRQNGVLSPAPALENPLGGALPEPEGDDPSARDETDARAGFRGATLGLPWG